MSAVIRVYGTDFDKEGVERALSQASKERKPEFRASAGTAPAPQPRRRAGDSDDASRTGRIPRSQRVERRCCRSDGDAASGSVRYRVMTTPAKWWASGGRQPPVSSSSGRPHDTSGLSWFLTYRTPPMTASGVGNFLFDPDSVHHVFDFGRPKDLFNSLDA